MAEYLCEEDCVFNKRLYIKGERAFFDKTPCEHFKRISVRAVKTPGEFVFETARAGELRSYAEEKGIDLSRFGQTTSADVLREYIREKGL